MYIMCGRQNNDFNDVYILIYGIRKYIRLYDKEILRLQMELIYLEKFFQFYNLNKNE